MFFWRLSQIKRRVAFCMLSYGIIGSLVFFMICRSFWQSEDRNFTLKKIEELIRTQASSLACKQPNLPVTSPEIMKFVHAVPKIDCSKANEDWVKCLGSICELQENAKIEYGPIKCSFTDVIRIDDFKSKDGNSVIAESYQLQKSDVVRASCESKDKKWSATLTGIRNDNQIYDTVSWDNLPHNALRMNVLMFGFDSLSRNAFIRKLPKTYEYITEFLEGDVLQGYNIVGDGTPQALIPILTGKTELELPDTRKRKSDSQFVDVYPFIWNQYKDAGYVTAFFEDVPELGTFTYRLKGFNEPPTDHYMRPYYLESLKERSNWPKLCTGEIPRHKVMLNAIRDFFKVYEMKPKFLFGFHGELSHDDYNLIGVADDDVLELLQNLESSGALNNTILIMMADHGHRFAEVRNTLQGKQEERLPFFSFTFPKWFKQKQNAIYTNFKENLNKLTTPFDIYSTLKDILNVETTGIADIQKRSVSLFSKIPAERSCAHAHIEPHWCACLDWQNLPLSHPIVERLGETLVHTLNEYTNTYRNLCELLSISEIVWAMKIAPNENLLKFHKNADLDGFVADLSAKLEVNKDLYQIKALLKPGNSLFEASLVHDLVSDKFLLQMSDISRINMYGSQARCIETHLPQLRKYCYCKNESKIKPVI
ncbi:unnamed protein product [Phaedon cochleariae]|uniref:Uncharacterized protein n=1 Tax=Phaedon cochleariae TaxID=80249 RepID=A0A9P0GTJ3_PHACE|nr:unnamed protein product [Phaedon cochleariae]